MWEFEKEDSVNFHFNFSNFSIQNFFYPSDIIFLFLEDGNTDRVIPFFNPPDIFFSCQITKLLMEKCTKNSNLHPNPNFLPNIHVNGDGVCWIVFSYLYLESGRIDIRSFLSRRGWTYQSVYVSCFDWGLQKGESLHCI